MSRYGKFGLMAMALAAATACTTTRVYDTPSASFGAQLSVERFLQAANQHDVRSMGRLFGTESGSAMETGGTFGCAFKKIGSWFGGSSCIDKREVEIRMDAIASILQHDDYQVIREQPVAGRLSPTTRIYVNMTTVDGVAVADVPFVVVQTGEGSWLIEEVDLQRVMAAR